MAKIIYITFLTQITSICIFKLLGGCYYIEKTQNAELGTTCPYTKN
jgi:hypothetical protein